MILDLMSFGTPNHRTRYYLLAARWDLGAKIPEVSNKYINKCWVGCDFYFNILDAFVHLRYCRIGLPSVVSPSYPNSEWLMSVQVSPI